MFAWEMSGNEGASAPSAWISFCIFRFSYDFTTGVQDFPTGPSLTEEVIGFKSTTLPVCPSFLSSAPLACSVIHLLRSDQESQSKPIRWHIAVSHSKECFSSHLSAAISADTVHTLPPTTLHPSQLHRSQ